MALSHCLTLRPLLRLILCPQSQRWSQPVKLLHTSSVRPDIQSRITSFFKASPKRSLLLKQKDQIPKDFSLIYKAPMEDYMKYGYPVTLLIFLMAPSIMMYHFYKNGKIFMYRKEVRELVFLDPEKELWFFAAAITLCTVGILAVLFKYPVRLYKRHDQQEYIAMFLSAVPMRVRKFQYTHAAQTQFRNPFYFFVPNCHYILGRKKKAILMAPYFRTPADLCEMLGMDWHLFSMYCVVW